MGLRPSCPGCRRLAALHAPARLLPLVTRHSGSCRWHCWFISWVACGRPRAALLELCMAGHGSSHVVVCAAALPSLLLPKLLHRAADAGACKGARRGMTTALAQRPASQSCCMGAVLIRKHDNNEHRYAGQLQIRRIPRIPTPPDSTSLVRPTAASSSQLSGETQWEAIHSKRKCAGAPDSASLVSPTAVSALSASTPPRTGTCTGGSRRQTGIG